MYLFPIFKEITLNLNWFSRIYWNDLFQNLRAAVYGIAAEDRLQIKRIAGRIVPAIATTTAAISALVSLRNPFFVQHSKIWDFKDLFMSFSRWL